MKKSLLAAALSAGLIVGMQLALGADAPKKPARPTPPARDPHTAGYVEAKELPDGTVPPADADGNFIIGPTHTPAPEMAASDGVPQGEIFNLTMESTDSKMFPGIKRDAGPLGTADPDDPAKIIVTTSHAAPYTRRVAVFVPKQYVAGSVASVLSTTGGVTTVSTPRHHGSTRSA